MIAYSYIFWTIFFTVYGQLVLKWRIANYGFLPDTFSKKIAFLFNVFLDPFVLSGLFSAFIASFFWMAAMTKFELSYAYPFMSLAFVFVLILSYFLFHEPITIQKIIGISFIIAGIIISSKSL